MPEESRGEVNDCDDEECDPCEDVA
jgi:hypothetical protein